MSGALTPREAAALRAAVRDGLNRGRSGFYPGFASTGEKHLVATIRALERRGLVARPARFSPRRIATDLGRALAEGAAAAPLPPPAPPRSYVD